MRTRTRKHAQRPGGRREHGYNSDPKLGPHGPVPTGILRVCTSVHWHWRGLHEYKKQPSDPYPQSLSSGPDTQSLLTAQRGEGMI